MILFNPDMNNKDYIVNYSIQLNSILDVPKIVLLNIKRFDNCFKEYLTQKVDEQSLLLALIDIYKIYITNGIVNIISLQPNSIKNRHEKFIIEFIRDNLVHLKHLNSYLK